MGCCCTLASPNNFMMAHPAGFLPALSVSFGKSELETGNDLKAKFLQSWDRTWICCGSTHYSLLMGLRHLNMEVTSFANKDGASSWLLWLPNLGCFYHSWKPQAQVVPCEEHLCSVSPISKLKFREVNQLTHDHTPYKWRCEISYFALNL